MVDASRSAGSRARLVPLVARRRLVAVALSPVLALVGVLIAPALPVQAAFSCNYVDHPNSIPHVQDPGGTFALEGQETAGHYSGNTVVPLTNGVSAAGIEAQCLLVKAGFNPGTIDGIFGPNSQAAAEGLQDQANALGAGIQEDGLPGPQTWPWLRCGGQGVGKCTVVRL